MQNENDTTEKRMAESVNQMRTALLEIEELVSAALYTIYATMGDTWKAYSAACANIRLQVKPPLASPEPDYAGLAEIVTRPNFDPEKMGRALEALACDKPVDFPVTFHTPSACAGARRSCFDALAEDYGLRLSLFRYGKSRKLVGVRRTQPNNPHNEHLYEVTDDHEGHLDFMRDGTWIATLTMGVQRGSTNSILCSILRNILKESARRNLVHKRAKARARAAAAEHPLAPVNPPMDIPPRPGLPEDDE